MLIGLMVVSVSATLADTVYPSADTYVRDGSFSGNNYGTVLGLTVQKSTTSGNTRETYLNFGFAGGFVSTATLRVYATKLATPTPTLWTYSADTNWNETTVVWNNKPAIYNPLGANTVSQLSPTYAWEEFDVSSYVRQERAAGKFIIGFALVETNTASGAMDVRSRESAFDPELVIVTNIPPTVSITSPSSGTVFSAPANITFSASASDSDGSISRVDFYTNGVLLGTDALSAYSVAWSGVPLGAYSLTAVAVDNLGLTTTSTVVNIIVNDPIVDANTNGIPDLVEDPSLPAAIPFALSPFVVTGAFEAEQFDAGGIGVGYSNVVNHSTNVYRVTGMGITNCNDLGGAYALRLKAGEWARYTFKVQLAGNYVVNARARGTNGGQFKFIFGTANGVSNYQTNAPALTGTIWQNLQRVVNLSTGYNSLRVEGMTDVGGLAADLNYFSIYPAFPVTSFPSLTNTLGQSPYLQWYHGVQGTNFLTAQSNSLTLQTAIEDTILAGGGTVSIPTGHYYLAQSPLPDPYGEGLPSNINLTNWETPPRNSGMTFAARIYSGANNTAQGSNIRIAGTTDPVTGTNATLLMAHNRCTTLFYIGSGWARATNIPFKNIAFENLTLKGNPHIRTNGAFEPGWYWNATYYLTNDAWTTCLGSPYTNYVVADPKTHQGVGSLLTFDGVRPMSEIAIKNCNFANASGYPIILSGCTDVLLVSNTFSMFNADRETNILFVSLWNADGTLTNKQPINPLPNNDGVTWNSPYYSGVGVFGVVLTNVVLIGNAYDGNPAYVPTNHGQWVTGDGIVWFQSGGNWYLSENRVDKFGIEGVQFNSGPSALVGNTFAATKENGIAAIAVTASANGVSGDAFDCSHSIVGNSFVNVRIGLTSWYSNLLTFCGNYVSNCPPMLATNVPWCDQENAMISFYSPQSLYANVSGNTVSNAGYAINTYGTNGGLVPRMLFALANDFSNIQRVDPHPLVFSRGTFRLESGTSNASPTNVIIARSIVGAAVSNPAHLSLDVSDASHFYLLQNIYRNTNGVSGSVVTDPANAPIHVY